MRQQLSLKKKKKKKKITKLQSCYIMSESGMNVQAQERWSLLYEVSVQLERVLDQSEAGSELSLSAGSSKNSAGMLRGSPAYGETLLSEQQSCRDQTTLGGFVRNHGEGTEPQQRLGSVTMARA